MNWLLLSDTVINLDAVLYINLYPSREPPMIQVCFAGNDNFVNVENPADVSKLRQLITTHAK